MLPPGAILELTIHQNAFCGPHVVAYSASPAPLAGFQGAASRHGRRGEESGSEWRERNSDINKDWTCKDKDQAYKDQDKDKD